MVSLRQSLSGCRTGSSALLRFAQCHCIRGAPFLPPPSTSVLTHRKEGSGNGGGVSAHSVPSFPNPGNGLLALFLKRFFFHSYIKRFQTLQNVFWAHFLSVLYNSLTSCHPQLLPDFIWARFIRSSVCVYLWSPAPLTG